jgi:hypothetical protein
MEGRSKKSKVSIIKIMDRRTYLISVFDDTLERINGDFEVHKTQQQSIAAQKLILETETLAVPAPRFDEKAQVLVTKNRSFEAAAQSLHASIHETTKFSRYDENIKFR